MEEEELMAKDINTRLTRLRERRKGPDNVSMEAIAKAATASLRPATVVTPEAWENRGGRYTALDTLCDRLDAGGEP